MKGLGGFEVGPFEDMLDCKPSVIIIPEKSSQTRQLLAIQMQSLILKSFDPIKFIPASSGHAKALVLLVHGRGGNLRVMEFLAKRFQVLDVAYLLIQAPFSEQREDQKARGESGWSWYLNRAEGIEVSRTKILKLIEELKAQGFGPHQIFWLGFSQGAIMGLDLFLRSADVFGGGLFVSGFLGAPEDYPSAFGSAAKKQRILITHGPRDEIITLEKAENSYEVLRKSGIPFEFKTFDKPHSFQMSQEVPYLEKRLQEWTADL